MATLPETMEVFTIAFITPPLASPAITPSNGPSESLDTGISLGVRHHDLSDVKSNMNTQKEHNSKTEKPLPYWI
jgi:hypothetical protein